MAFGKSELNMSKKNLNANASQYVEELRAAEAEVEGSQGPEQVVEEFTGAEVEGSQSPEQVVEEFAGKVIEEFRRAYAFCMSAAKAIENEIRRRRALRESRVSVQSNQEPGADLEFEVGPTQPSQPVIPLSRAEQLANTPPPDSVIPFKEVPDEVLEDDAGPSTDDFEIDTGRGKKY